MNDHGQKIRAWWKRSLDRENARGRALAAKLRRGDAVSVLCEPEVHELAQTLDIRDSERLVRLVQVLAEVRGDDAIPLAKALGGKDPALSHLRFQKLMRASQDEIATGLRRALPLVGYRCNIAVLGQDLLFWGEKTRTRWCFDYFGAEAPRSMSEETAE
jgi:CRISPR system Cascade subunit CasB